MNTPSFTHSTSISGPTHFVSATAVSDFAPAPAIRQRASDRFRPVRSVGNWQLMELIGQGRFADVFSARPMGCQPDWPADYAVKLPKADDYAATALLAREAEVGRQVSQAHLISILDVRIDQTQSFVVMPRLDGAPVSDVIAQVGRFSIRQALWVTRQIAEGLQALHDQNWFHSDVKPTNMIVSADGHATLIDLGFALRRSESMFDPNRPTLGTLNYMAPEMMTSACCVDQRIDIYSLGISLFEMLTGQLPFIASNEADLVAFHRQQPLPDPRMYISGLPAEVVMVLNRMTAKEPLRRPHSAANLIEQLMPLEVDAIRRQARFAEESVTNPFHNAAD